MSEEPLENSGRLTGDQRERRIGYRISQDRQKGDYQDKAGSAPGMIGTSA